MANDAKKKKGIRSLKQKAERWIAGRPLLLFVRKQHHSEGGERDAAACPGRRSVRDRVIGLHNKIWRRKTNEDTVAVCGCGRPLEAGWQCSSCRLECPTCHRALGEGEQCSRCHSSQ